MKPEIIETLIYEAPCGAICLGSIDGRLCMCDWVGSRRSDDIRKRLTKYFKAQIVAGSNAVIMETSRRLDEYFKGLRQSFDLDIVFAGTDFQKSVWSSLLDIKAGDVISYGELSRRAGHPSAVRAAANAIAVNALSIIVPCHRVVGSDGNITGYNGGNDVKRFLLDLEKRL